jgi:hypothetical protein
MKGDVFKKVDLGPLPVETIARYLNLKLAPGDVVFYPKAQRHAFGKDLERILCLEHLPDVVATPTHVGQQPGALADRLERNQRPQSDQAMAVKLIRALLAGRAAGDVIVLQDE